MPRLLNEADVESLKPRPDIARMAFFEKDKLSLNIYAKIPTQLDHKLHVIEKVKNKWISAR
jgi:hypothetical protein